VIRQVLVYVEGPADSAAYEALLRPLIDAKVENGVAVSFHPAWPGHNKESILRDLPRRAADILTGRGDIAVVAMPDLHPRDCVAPHGTPEELRAELAGRFCAELARRGIDDQRIAERFHVHCAKHDLEALVLACPESLARELGCSAVERTWTEATEDQDFGSPPKRIVERLFTRHGRTYRAPAHAPRILAGASYQELAERCPQCFGPFVALLEGL